jgi:hypothetical protein
MKSKTHPRRAPAAGPFRLGVDVGRVLVSGEGSDTSFFSASDELALATPEVPGAIAAVVRLARLLQGRVWLVSKCGPRIQQRTRAWLDHVGFYASTGLPADHVHFCRERKEKAPICKRLGISAFIDDREDVLASMEGLVEHRLLFGSIATSLPGVVAVPTWGDAEPLIARLATGWSGSEPAPAR